MKRRNINTILENDIACSKSGAQMGRPDEIGDPGQIKIERVTFVDGDYDRGGAYWGGGKGTQPLFCGWRHGDNEPTRVFTRAANYDEAEVLILTELNRKEPSPLWTV